jgi:2-polyprenyl-3-methyl-5-hydroxy-6-metoxy-1,4-benzoquinol methylase
MQSQIARHCIAWAPGRIDFLDYLQLSSVRFYKAYCHLETNGARSLCDIGGFWGVWPMTAKSLGFDVAMTESLKFYGRSFDALFDQIRESGVEIFDYDPFLPGNDLPRQFDLVTAMAVLEHYPHSLNTFMGNTKRMLNTVGKLYLEVPNIAYWPKRTALLMGRTPLPPVEDIYLSEEPFIGHHHEFTMAELHELSRLAGLKVTAEEYFNYTLDRTNTFKLFIRYPIMSAAFFLRARTRECIAVLCEKQDPLPV